MTIKSNRLLHFAGWSAYLSAGALIFAFVTSIFLRTKEGRLTIISDISEILSLFFMIPIVFATYQLTQKDTKAFSLITCVIGVIGTVYAAVITFLLNFGPKGFGDSGVFMNTTLGLWFLLSNLVLLSGKHQSTKLSWLGIFIGVLYLLSIIGLLAKESLMVLFIVWVFSIPIIYPVWAFGIGRTFLKSN